MGIHLGWFALHVGQGLQGECHPEGEPLVPGALWGACHKRLPTALHFTTQGEALVTLGGGSPELVRFRARVSLQGPHPLCPATDLSRKRLWKLPETESKTEGRRRTHVGMRGHQLGY